MKPARCLVAALLLVAGGTAAALPDTAGAVRRGYVEVQSGQVHYRYTAPAATARAGAPVALFHLSPNSGQVFSDLLPLLGRDRIAVAFDTPGYGMSDPVPDPQTIAAYAGQLAAAMAALGLDSGVDLVGYHTGAAIALELAQRYPAQAGRLALVAVPVLTADERAAGAALPPIPFDEAGEWAKQEWQRSWRWRGPGQDRQSVLATFAEKLRPGVRERGATAVLAYDTAAALERARAPLLLVRPRDDLWTATGRARALRPDAGWVELPDFGHGLFHAAPQRMAAILRDFFDAAD
jgi:pimeloyl-ACP methyl ester carboxylesterase